MLKDLNYVNIINNKIEEIKQQYAVPLYNPDNFHKIPNDQLQLTINDQLFLETLMMELRGKSISYYSFTKKQNNVKEKILAEKILNLETNLKTEEMETLEKLKMELQEIRKIRINGSVIRSRAINIHEGEKPTKYFCALETHNFVSKTIPKLEIENGKIITNQFEILHEAELFYTKLYSNMDSSDDFDLEKKS